MMMRVGPFKVEAVAAQVRDGRYCAACIALWL
jgi:hypothetical protein